MNMIKFKSDEELSKMNKNELYEYIVTIQDKMLNSRCKSCKKIDFKAENMCSDCDKKCCEECLQNCFFCDSQICKLCKKNMCMVDMYENFCPFCI